MCKKFLPSNMKRKERKRHVTRKNESYECKQELSKFYYMNENLKLMFNSFFYNKSIHTIYLGTYFGFICWFDIILWCCSDVQC